MAADSARDSSQRTAAHRCCRNMTANSSTSTDADGHARSLSTDDASLAADAAVTRETWMNDKHSAECVLCFRAFTLTLRRHHCRKCGVLVCSKCSSHRLALDINGSTSKKGARVCDNCYESSSLNPKGASGVLSPLDADAPTSELTASNGALGDLNLTIPSLPPWSYLFLRSQPAPLPSSDVSTALAAELASQLVPIGRLFVRVVRCVNLPSMSSILQSCDAYVSVHFGGAAHRTRIVTNSLNPHFDSSFWFDVHNATEDKLTLNIFDWDALGKNKHIAYLQLTLAQCATMQQRKPVWFDIDHLSLEAAKKDNMKDMKKNKLKQALKKKDREALDEAAQTDEAAKAAAAANDVRVARPRIQLEVQYVGAEAGEFATHLLPSDPSRPSLSVRKDATLIKKSQFEKVPAFDIDILYKDLFRFIALLQPITSFLMAIGPLLWWTTPWHSFLGLVVCVAVCQRPWLFLVLLELLALWGMARALVRRQWMEYDARATDFTRARREAVAQYNLAAKKKEHAIFRLAHNTKNLLTGHEDDATDSFNQNATSVFDKLNPFHTDSSGNALDASSQAGLNSVVTHTLNGLLISFGLKGSLYYYQDFLTWLCELFEWWWDLFNWKHFGTTRTIFICLIVATLYSCFFPQRYLLFLINFYLLTLWTAPSMWFFASLWGGIAFMGSRTPAKQ